MLVPLKTLAVLIGDVNPSHVFVMHAATVSVSKGRSEDKQSVVDQTTPIPAVSVVTGTAALATSGEAPSDAIFISSTRSMMLITHPSTVATSSRTA